jgi:hypothetical protein
MNDHSHNACPERLEKDGGAAKCCKCGDDQHECKEVKACCAEAVLTDRLNFRSAARADAKAELIIALAIKFPLGRATWEEVRVLLESA